MVYVGGQKSKTRNTLLNNIQMHNMDSILNSMVAFSEGCGQTNKQTKKRHRKVCSMDRYCARVHTTAVDKLVRIGLVQGSPFCTSHT